VISQATGVAILQVVAYAAIQPLTKMATRDRVTCSDTPYTVWLGASLDQQIIGFAGVSFGQKHSALSQLGILSRDFLLPLFPCWLPCANTQAPQSAIVASWN